MELNVALRSFAEPTRVAWSPLELCGVLRSFSELYGFVLENSLEPARALWSLLKFCGILGSSPKLSGALRSFPEPARAPWSLLEFCGVPRSSLALPRWLQPVCDYDEQPATCQRGAREIRQPTATST
eukprot:87778-Alexandrium_andersonii.AAC.1